MIPVGLIIALVTAGARAASSRSGGGSAKKRADGTHWNVLVWIFVVPGALLHLFYVLGGNSATLFPFNLPILVVEAVVICPWWIARWVFVPLHLPALAYGTGVLSDWFWTRDHRGGGAVAAAWSLLGAKTWNAGAAAWIERRVERGTVLRGGGVVAAGLLAAGRGDLDGARLLFRSVDDLEPAITPNLAVRIAAEWLAGDAAARGDWKDVERLGRDLRPRSRATRFLGAVATRLRGVSFPPSDAQLVVRWLVAPHRLRMLPLLRRGLAAPADLLANEAPRPVEIAPRGDAIGDALAMHAAVLARPAAGSADLAAVGHAWDAARSDPATRRLAEERALILAVGSAGADRALAQLELAVEIDLMALAREVAIPISALAEHSETLSRASLRLRSELLDEIEMSCAALTERVVDARDLPPIDEWREWLALSNLCDRAAVLCGVELSRLAFPSVQRAGCKLAVWLWNIRKERALGNAIFRWLLAAAETVEDAQAVDLQRENVDCGSV